MKKSTFIIIKIFCIFYLYTALLYARNFKGEVYLIKKYSQEIVIKSPDLSKIKVNKNLYIINENNEAIATVKVKRFYNTIINSKIISGNITGVKIGMPVYTDKPKVKKRLKEIKFQENYNYFYWLSSFQYEHKNKVISLEKQILLPKIYIVLPTGSDEFVDIDHEDVKELYVNYNKEINELKIKKIVLKNGKKLELKKYKFRELDRIEIPEKLVEIDKYTKKLMGKNELYRIRLLKVVSGLEKIDSIKEKLSGNAGKVVKYFKADGAIVTTPIIHNNKIFVTTRNGILYCLDSDNYDVLWKYKARHGAFGFSPSAINTLPLIHEDLVFFGDVEGYIHCVNALNGELVWKYNVKMAIYSNPRISDDKLYIGSNNMYFYCMDFKSGRIIWKFKSNNWIKGSAFIDKKYVYFGSGDWRFYCLDKNTGKLKWRYKAKGPIHSSPYISGENIYFGCNGNYIYCLNKADGSLVWRSRTGGDVISTSIVVGGNLYFGSKDYYLYCLDAYTGQIFWKFKTRGCINGSPAYASGMIFFGSNDRYIYCLNALDGELFWKVKTKSSIYSSPIIRKGKLYIGNNDQNLYVIDTGFSDIEGNNGLIPFHQ